jgi:thiol-disulfide isomerase/thioredoxin
MSRSIVRLSISLALFAATLAGCSDQTAMKQTATDRNQADGKTESSSEVQNSAELSVGMKAPPIEIAKWVQGKPVESFQPGHVYVVEFWATWCGPCRAGMPHISDLQELYQDDVTFIGVTREDEETVSKFLKKPHSEESEKTWNDVISYTLALDDNDATNTAYMDAAGRNGIPCAFVVGGDGYVEWIGHPAAIDDPLEQIVAGTWDREEYLVQYEKDQRAAAAMQEAMASLSKAQQEEDWETAIGVADELIKQQPEQPAFQMLKSSILLKADRPEEALAIVEKLGETHWEEAQMLNGLAWSLASNTTDDANLALAERFAKRASELTDDKDASILDTLAKVYYEQGNLDKAIEWQTKAVEAADGAEQIQSTLDSYQAERDGEETSAPEEDEEAADSGNEAAASENAIESDAIAGDAAERDETEPTDESPEDKPSGDESSEESASAEELKAE